MDGASAAHVWRIGAGVRHVCAAAAGDIEHQAARHRRRSRRLGQQQGRETIVQTKAPAVAVANI